VTADVVIVVITFLLVEPLTALVHRAMMHGFAWSWHRSHHQPVARTFEGNDLFPVVFAALTILALAVGVSVPALHVLVPIGIGITLYGFAYLIVHDVVIHRRLRFVPVPEGCLRYWRDAHNVHHIFGREPYGFLAPIVPARLREAAGEHPADRISRERPAGSSDVGAE
jgi:beta-carotene 3-hydroxylase